MVLDKDLLQILACPKCNKKLFYSEDKNKLKCNREGLEFEVKNNIPYLVIKDDNCFKEN